MVGGVPAAAAFFILFLGANGATQVKFTFHNNCPETVWPATLACLAFGTDEYCCRGRFASPAACGPSRYSKLFKAQCPQAYSYAFDDGSSTFTCGNATGYRLTFCPAAANN
uniref:Thaumatin-like protein n=1 Tax=Oryza brachyantha TaxID=4533 RepID=J3MKA0_ORYBR